MKKFIALLASLLLVVGLMACGTRPATPDPDPEPDVEAPADPENDDGNDLPEGTEIVEYGDWVIGIITGTVSQGEEEYFGGILMEQRFGADRILRATYPDDFNAEMPTTIANVQALVDAGAQAIVFCQAVPGAIAAMQETREQFGDILFVLGTPHEIVDELAYHADVILIIDDLARGHSIMAQAIDMGADTFAHVSFPRHLAMENIAARRELLMEKAEANGIEWVELTAPDPASEGAPVTQQFILENLPLWISEHGENTAFFSTNCAMQEPLITQIAAYGGLYPEQCCPSPLHALPAAFNVTVGEEHQGDMVHLIDVLRDEIAAQGGAGRFATWPVPVNILFIEVGTLYAIEYLEGRTNGRHDHDVLMRILNEVAASYGASFEVRNWPNAEGTGYHENFYRVFSTSVTF